MGPSKIAKTQVKLNTNFMRAHLYNMLIIECAKFILKTSESQLTVEAMTCEAIRINFHGNELYFNKTSTNSEDLQINEHNIFYIVRFNKTRSHCLYIS